VANVLKYNTWQGVIQNFPGGQALSWIPKLHV